MSHQQEQGFYPALLPVAIRKLLNAAGYKEANWSDLYFFQDAYRPPASLKDKVLLFFGDPLMNVEIVWEPTSLLIDYTL